MERVTRLLKTEFARFVIVGGISAVLEYSLYFLFKLILEYLIANVLAFGLTNVVTFILSKLYVFEPSGKRKRHEAALFFIFLIGALAVNQAVLWSLVEFAGMDDKIAKALAIAVTVIWNFFTRKHFVFKNREVAAQRSATNYPSDNL